MVKIVLPSVWAAGGRSTFEVPAGTLADIIKRFVAAYPGYRRRLLGTDSEPASYLNIGVDDDLVPRQSWASTVVATGSTITIVPPMAGG